MLAERIINLVVRLNLFVGAGLLSSKLVAGEAKDLETFVRVLRIQFAELREVHFGQTSIAGNVRH